MDFIERLFHIAPDYGSGTLEAAILIAAVVAPVALAILWINSKRRPVRGPYSSTALLKR